MSLPSDWREFIESLNSNNVEYVIIGAVALAHYGYPRYTGDIDILIRNSPENAQRLEAAIASCGLSGLGLQASDFLESYSVIQLGIPPNRIDLLTSCTGVSFDDAWSGRVEATMEGIRTAIIGRDELIRNKPVTNRPQDQADLDFLENRLL
jgi:hypothetical protein